MNHRKWSTQILSLPPYGDLIDEHNSLYADWKQCSLDAERLAKVNGDLCDKITELQQPIRVPFSDAQIEKMAKAARSAFGDDVVDWENSFCRDNWRSAIRAALSAGGIEPCTPPEYKPADVAFSTERVSDEELEHVFEQGREEGALVNMEGIRAVRSRVEAPLLAEIARLGADCAWNKQAADSLRAELDAVKAENKKLSGMYGLEYAQKVTAELEAVKAERDELRGVRERLMLIVEQQAQELQDDPQFRACRKELSELKIELAALRQPVESRPVKVRWDVTAEQMTSDIGYASELPLMRTAMSYLAAHAVIDVPQGVPTDAEVEALARVLRAAPDMWWPALDETWDRVKDMYIDQARAAFAHIGRVPVGWELDVTEEEIAEAIEGALELESEHQAAAVMALLRERGVVVDGSLESSLRAELDAVKAELAALRQPVDADAWKTPLRIAPRQIVGSEFRLEINCDVAFAACMTSPRNGTGFHFNDPSDAARAAQWLASYSAAHGCPVSGAIQYKRNPANDGFVDMPVESRPVKVRWGVTESEVSAQLWGAVDAEQAAHSVMDYLAAHAVIDVPTGVPSVQELVSSLMPVIEEGTGSFMQGGLSPSWQAWVELLTSELLKLLAPHMTTHATPTDAEVEALARVLADACAEGFEESHATYLRRLARAAFAHIGTRQGECQQCAKLKVRLEDSQRMEGKRLEIMHRYEQDMKKAHAVLSAALEGE